VDGQRGFSEYVNAGVPGAYRAWEALDPALIAAAEQRVSPSHQPFAVLRPHAEPAIKTGVEFMTLAVM